MPWRRGSTRSRTSAGQTCARTSTDSRASRASRGSVRADAGLPRLRADRDRLLQALENLASNALKFSPAEGRVEVTAEFQSAGAVRFTVSDSGPGIPAADRERIFDRFWRSTGGEKGVGLGLALVKGIVAGHGGTVWLEDTSGSGATFHFTIPVAASRDG